MKDLFIRKIDYAGQADPETAGQLLEKYTVIQQVDILNWKSFPYKPEVRFRIAHCSNDIWLKYYVREKHILACETRINGDVYRDSCVEFFVSFTESGYYNFEFNCIGTPHLGFGPGRNNRKPVDPERIKSIQTLSTLGKTPFEERKGDFEWELTIVIPESCLQFDGKTELGGLKARGNFYKCGDATSEPHFVTWNPVGTEKPDYHRPEFFGSLNFE